MITAQDLEPMIEAIKADFKIFMDNYIDESDENDISYRKWRIRSFNDSIRIDEGKAYLKVVKDGSVHSFVVRADNNQFKAGDILFPASWKAPAKNFARGNVFTDLSRVRWSSTQ